MLIKLAIKKTIELVRNRIKKDDELIDKYLRYVDSIHLDYLDRKDRYRCQEILNNLRGLALTICDTVSDYKRTNSLIVTEIKKHLLGDVECYEYMLYFELRTQLEVSLEKCNQLLEECLGLLAQLDEIEAY